MGIATFLKIPFKAPGVFTYVEPVYHLFKGSFFQFTDRVCVLFQEIMTSESGECLDWNLLMKRWQGLVRNFESEPQCEDVSTTYTHNEGLFENIEEEESFFRPALRSLLVITRPNCIETAI